MYGAHPDLTQSLTLGQLGVAHLHSRQSLSASCRPPGATLLFFMNLLLREAEDRVPETGASRDRVSAEGDRADLRSGYSVKLSSRRQRRLLHFRRREGVACAPVMTSGNGNSSQHSGETKPAQAVVESQILTHLIEGFVIQEGAEPFPVERPSFSIESLRRHATGPKMDGVSPKELKAQQEPMLTCELCGRVDFAYVFKRSKRFCSTVCAKRYNVGCTKRMGLFPNRKTTLENMKKQRALNGNHKHCSLEPKKKTAPSVQKPAPAALSSGHSVYPAQGESSQCSDLSAYKRPPSPLSASQRVPVVQESELPLLPYSFLPSDPGQWNIEAVYEFISSLPGCLEIAEEFRSQEIDGQALLLLKEDHLMGAMNIKLGPALKIFAQISMLRDS
ncbi:polyhomeotic-like protein 2 [Pempheris klunzingeri]|uniref:polyhomeotic-like protein 2 n=1 Tax=Pempheris klunzingeri TaxID=3127111 RepID=UPI003981085F